MKNIRTTVFFILIISTIFISYCAGTQTGVYIKPPVCESLSDILSGELKLPGKGWSDGDTFWVIAAGNSKPGLKDSAGRKASAIRAAVLNAQSAAVKEFSAISGTDSKGNNTGGNKVSTSGGEGEPVYPLAVKGVVTCSYCDANSRCIVLYTVSMPSLKKILKIANSH